MHFYGGGGAVFNTERLIITVLNVFNSRYSVASTFIMHYFGYIGMDFVIRSVL